MPGSVLGTMLEVNVFHDFSLLVLTRYLVFALSCFSFIWSSVFPEFWKVFRALFLCLIASLISEFYQGTLGFTVKVLVLPIDWLAALIIVAVK
jgi:hypothetical protein